MDQIDTHYLKTVINILTGADKPVKSFEYGGLKLAFHDEAPDEPVEPTVTGFTPGPPPKPADDSPEGMYKRLTRTLSVPEFTPAPPKKSEG